MKNYETKEVVEKKEILKFITCDNCDKVIDMSEEYINLNTILSTGSWYWKDSESTEKQYCGNVCFLKDMVDNKELSDLVKDDDFDSLNIQVVNKGKLT